MEHNLLKASNLCMHYRVWTPQSIWYNGFNQYDITLTKDQSVSKSVMDAFEGENMKLNTVFWAIELTFIFMAINLR